MAVALNPVSADDKIDFSRLSVIVGQLGGPAGEDIERQLSILCISNPVISHDADRIRRSIEVDHPDLVLCTVASGREQAHDIMHGVRHQEIGPNPFVVMITLGDHKAPSDVARTTDAGTDEIIAAPFNRDIFVMRINELARNRKKFVATTNFVGPTRRSSARPGRKTAEEFEVPNPVRATGTGVSRDELGKEIARAASSLNIRKLSSDVTMIRELVGEILPDYEKSAIGETFLRRIEMLRTGVETVRRRAVRLGFADVVSLCEIADNVVSEIKARPVPPNLKHLRAMPKMVIGFETALLSISSGRLAS